MTAAAPPLSDPELARLRAALRARYEPADALEDAAIDALAAAYRRRAELDVIEAQVLAALKAGKAEAGLPSLATLCRYAARVAADIERAEARLLKLRAERLVRKAAGGAAPPTARSCAAEPAPAGEAASAARKKGAAPPAAHAAPLARLVDELLVDLTRVSNTPRERGALSRSASALALAAGARLPP